MNHYTVTITFDTLRELSAAELEELETALITQVLEPATHEGEDVDYETYHQIIDTVQEER